MILSRQLIKQKSVPRKTAGTLLYYIERIMLSRTNRVMIELYGIYERGMT